MFQLLLALLIIDAFVLIAIVLLQAGKGGGLAAMGAAGAGSDSLFGSRQTATLLTRLTWWAGGIFLALAFVLSFLSAGSRPSQSILRGSAPPVPATTPAIPGATAPAAGEATTPAGTAPATGTPAAPAADTGAQ